MTDSPTPESPATSSIRSTLRVNGVDHDLDLDPRTLLVHALREQVGLTGTNVGCLTGDCGACTVLIDGKSTKSCSVLALTAAGAEVTTVEALSNPDGSLHPVQQAFLDEFAFQCGYCVAGMLLVTCELLEREPDPDDSQIEEAINGNLCRCTGYGAIRNAVRRAAVQGAEGGTPA